MAKHFLASLHPMSTATMAGRWLATLDGSRVTDDKGHAYPFTTRRATWLAASGVARGKAIRIHKVIDGKDVAR